VKPLAVLLMAYGSPERLEDIPAYLADIRSGRAVSPEAVAELTERYRRVGVPTPLRRITESVAAQLRTHLAELLPETPVRTYVGMKHWQPRIAEAVAQAASDGGEVLVALAMAPHFSGISIGGYRQRVHRALQSLSRPLELQFIESWHDDPGYVTLLARNVRRALGQFADPQGVVTIFTAHSLPARILAAGDPYRDQLLTTSRLVAEEAGAGSWRFSFQSASETGEPWLGPDLLETLEDLARQRVPGVVVAPVGFISDHLEILYDIDVEARERAAQLKIKLVRAASLNDDPGLAAALARLCAARLAPAGPLTSSGR
jgi:ferrochelatase